MASGAELGQLALTGLWLMLPAYLANMLPVLIGRGGGPIDGGRVWSDGRRMLGDGKTWRGLLLSPLVAATMLWLFSFLVATRLPGHAEGQIVLWHAGGAVFVLSYAMGLGALLGDAVESFFKRRTGRDRGQPWVPFDQLDFVVGALLVGYLLTLLLSFAGLVPGYLVASVWTWPRVLFIVLATPALHFLVNVLGYKLGLKNEPW